MKDSSSMIKDKIISKLKRQNNKEKVAVQNNLA